MDGPDQRPLTPDELREALERLGPEPARRRGAFALAVGDGTVPAWANAAAADLFARPDREPLLGRLLAAMADPPLQDGAPRSERLRFFEGYRARTVGTVLRRATLASGRQVTAVSVPDHRVEGGRWDLSALPIPPAADRPPTGTSPVPAVSAPAELPPAAPRPAAGPSRHRFLWRTDAQDRVTSLEGSVPALAGLGDGTLVGRALPAALAVWDCDPEGALAAGFAGRTGWRGLHLRWPLADGSGAVSVTLGAVPTLGPDRAFGGFSGFGIADVSRVTPLAGPLLPLPEPEGAPAASPPRENGGGATEPSSSKVVMLRPAPPAAPPPPAAAMVPRGGAEGPDALSPSERSAFEEIGLALGGLGASPPSAEDDADLSAILDLVPVAAWWRADGGAARVNRAFLALSRDASAEALAARGGLDHILDPVDAAGPPDGSDRAASLRDAAGRPVPVTVSRATRARPGRDATVLTLARRSEEVALADAAEDALVLLDGQGRLTHANRAAERLFGRGRADLVGCAIPDLLAPASRTAAAALVAAAAGSGEAPSAPVQAIRADGTAAPLRLTLHRLGPGLTGAALRDEGAAERLRVEHGVALERLDRMQQVKADFLTRLSHDLRTPLSAILGFTEVILDERFGPMGNPRYRDYLLDIHRSGGDVLTLVNDLLDLSRMEAGRVDLALEPVDVNRTVAESVALLQPDAHRERVIMRTSLPPRLPPALVDEGALRQMLAHLLSNAVRFNEPGGQVIVSTALNDAGAVAVRIRDTGVGMSDDEVAAAIDPARPFAVTATVNPGSGLGLPLTRALAEANGASVAIRSRKGEGTLVELLLRADPAQPVRVPAA